MTVDISRLNQFVENDLLQPIESSILESNIPYHLRDTKNRWFSFSKRARIVVASKERVDTNLIQRIVMFIGMVDLGVDKYIMDLN